MKYFTNDVLIETVRHLKTIKNLPEYLDNLDTLNNNLYKETSAIYDTLYDGLGYNFKTYIQSVLNISSADVTKLKDIIAELKSEVHNIHQVKFVLAFQPLDSFIDVLSLWVNSNLGNDLLLNYEVNPDIISGVIIIYKGKYLDYSSTPLIDTYFEEHTADVQKLLD